MLEISQVRYAYEDQQPIDFPSFQLDYREPGLLLGNSGSGKTTLLHLIGGLLALQGGEVNISGTFLSKLSTRQLVRFRGKHIGFIFQKPHLVQSISVLDNVLLAQSCAGVAASKSQARKVLSELDLSKMEYKMPSALSQGQQQRVAVARALVNDPKLILADEPTASLDDANTSKVLDMLVEKSTAHNANLIIATHDHRVKDRIKKQIEL